VTGTDRRAEPGEGTAATGTLLIVGGRLEAIQLARELGLRVVLLQHKERLLPGQAEAADALILVDYLDWEVARPMVQAAHGVYGFTRVMSLVEQAMELVGRINDLLGLEGTSHEVARRFHDKLAMREWLHETGFETVAAERIDDAAALRAFGSRHGYPLVLKPADGTASRGVVRVQGPEEIDEVWHRAVELRGRDDLPMARFYPVDRFVAEEFIDGPEYSVESFSFDGRHVVVSVTDKLCEGVVEMGHAEPAVLAPADEAALVDHVVGFLGAMGLRNGVAHTEVKMSPTGPRIIEGHDRVSGDRVMDLVQAVYGIDLERYAVGWPFRLVPELTGRPAPRGGAATRFLTAEPGTVAAIEGVAEVRAHPGVLDVEIDVEVGTQIGELTESFDRPGQVLVTAEDTAAAIELATALAKKIRVVTRPTGAEGPGGTHFPIGGGPGS
jgi:biotin carboxylase